MILTFEKDACRCLSKAIDTIFCALVIYLGSMSVLYCRLDVKTLAVLYCRFDVKTLAVLYCRLDVRTLAVLYWRMKWRMKLWDTESKR